MYPQGDVQCEASELASGYHLDVTGCILRERKGGNILADKTCDVEFLESKERGQNFSGYHWRKSPRYTFRIRHGVIS